MDRQARFRDGALARLSEQGQKSGERTEEMPPNGERRL